MAPRPVARVKRYFASCNAIAIVDGHKFVIASKT
jgi:hypothetical protein